jgi:adenylate cyclase class 2
MLEVEAKYRCADWEPVTARLLAWGAVAGEPREDADHYFNAPDRDFARTDEAIRVRRTGPHCVITYKGPKRDLETKTRTEIELPLADGPDSARTAAQLLVALGYRPVAGVTKTRRVYRFDRGGFACEACLDDVGPVGQFVELEIQADEDRYEAARTALLATAAELGLRDPERRSYLELLLQLKHS